MTLHRASGNLAALLGQRALEGTSGVKGVQDLIRWGLQRAPEAKVLIDAPPLTERLPWDSASTPDGNMGKTA